MLESSHPETTFKSRKSKPSQARLAQRFWPESLVQTIQSGSSTIQFPQQTVHVISSDLKEGLPITVVSNNNQLVSTGIPIQCVQSDKLPILTMLSCPTQALSQAELIAVATTTGTVNNNRVVTTVSIDGSTISHSGKSDEVSEQSLTDSSHGTELEITSS